MSGPKVIAHRGASSAERENTIAAFERARSMQADAVELDVRSTADGQMVVHHNPHLGDGRLIFELDRVDLPNHIPELEEALDACRPLVVNIEIKNSTTDPDHDPVRGLAQKVVDLVEHRNIEPEVLISSFDLETIDRVRSLAPHVDTALLTYEGDSERLVELCSERGHKTIHPFDKQVDETFMAAAKRHGLAVNVWTVNDPERMVELARLGVDGIVTDVPDVARAALASA